MKLWILGKKGLLGSTLIRLCKAKNISFIATDRDEADITCKESLKKKLYKKENNSITHIINCAAYTNVDKAEEESHLAYLINAKGPENIALLAQTVGARVIHISSDYVFDGKQNTPYLETDLCSPVNRYGKTKWEGEQNLLNTLPSSCIIRASWLFGEGGKNFISSVFEKIRKEEVLKVVADQKSRVTLAIDLAEVILELLCHSGIFHFANRGDVSRFDIATLLLEKAKKLSFPICCKKIEPVSYSAFPLPAQRPGYSVLNTTKIETALGHPIRSWQSALEEYLKGRKNE